jgi:hypothetical protein
MKMNVFLPIDRKRIVDPLAATVPSCFHAYACLRTLRPRFLWIVLTFCISMCCSHDGLDVVTIPWGGVQDELGQRWSTPQPVRTRYDVLKLNHPQH